jgi:polysaccharide transporter, PST family
MARADRQLEDGLTQRNSEGPEVRGPTSAKRAGAITIAGQLVKTLVQFVGLIAFSHLLSPRDVGLIAMLSVFIMLGELLRDFGISQAAIQTKDLTHGQATNLFWSNTLIGVALTSALYLAAPAVAAMYGEPVLQSIAPWVGLSFTVNALQTQFQVQLARARRFAALTVTDATSQILGLAAGLTAALAGASYWSLVVQMLSIYTALLILRVIITRWWPGLPRREPGMAPLYLFGVHTGLSQLVQYVASNVDTYIIGVRWGAAPLGVYNRAFQMFSVPANQLLAPLTNVALPLLSQARHDGRDFYPLLWKAQMAISMALTFVFMLGASIAEPLVRIALGPAWHESATILAILSIGGAAQGLSYMAFWAFLASGNARQLLFHSLVTKPLLAACIVVGSLWGVQGVAWGFSTGLVLSWFISLTWLHRCDGMPAWKFMRSGVHVLMSGLIAGGLGWTFVTHLSTGMPTVVSAAGGAVLASGVYALLVLSSASTRRFIAETSGPTRARLRGLVSGA